MKSVSIMEAQHNLSKVLRSIGPNERLALTRNKKIVAELSIHSSETAPTFPDFAARAAATWGGDWTGSTSGDFLDASRGDR